MTSVVSRIGTASTRIGSNSVATVVPATFQLAVEPECGEREAEHLAAGVAHEDSRGALRPQVERQEAGARERERKREREHGVVRVDRDRVDREEDGRDRCERRREAVHVVEQVEGVRHPDEPDECDEAREEVVGDQPGDRQSLPDHDPGGGELRGQLRDRAERVEVVEKAGDEEDRAASENRQELVARRRCIGRDRQSDAGQDPGEDADPTQHRGCPLVPAIRSGSGCQAPRQRCPEEQSDHPGRG